MIPCNYLMLPARILYSLHIHLIVVRTGMQKAFCQVMRSIIIQTVCGGLSVRSTVLTTKESIHLFIFYLCNAV